MRSAGYAAVLVLMAAAVSAATYDPSHAAFARVLEARVHDGLVDYRGLKADPAGLDAYLEQLASVDERTFSGWVLPERMAYLVNLHNASVLQMVARKYPVSSFGWVGGWFGDPLEMRTVRLFGNRITLEILREKILWRHYADPGMYLALSLAERGGPPLRDEPYTGARFQEQVLDQGRRFLADARWNRIDEARGRLELSPVFRRHREAFAARAGSLEVFVKPFLPEPLAARDWTIRFADGDRSLNDAGRR